MTLFGESARFYCGEGLLKVQYKYPSHPTVCPDILLRYTVLPINTITGGLCDRGLVSATQLVAPGREDRLSHEIGCG
jgi:hypothetical protein